MLMSSMQHEGTVGSCDLTFRVALKPDGPPQDACKPMHGSQLGEGSHGDAACAEAELMPQV